MSCLNHIWSTTGDFEFFDHTGNRTQTPWIRILTLKPLSYHRQKVYPPLPLPDTSNTPRCDLRRLGVPWTHLWHLRGGVGAFCLLLNGTDFKSATVAFLLHLGRSGLCYTSEGSICSRPKGIFVVTGSTMLQCHV